MSFTENDLKSLHQNYIWHIKNHVIWFTDKKDRKFSSHLEIVQCSLRFLVYLLSFFPSIFTFYQSWGSIELWQWCVLLLFTQSCGKLWQIFEGRWPLSETFLILHNVRMPCLHYFKMGTLLSFVVLSLKWQESCFDSRVVWKINDAVVCF